ncbi:DUF6115 domain-containing protein [Niallia endozanthoxylica]|uniref:Uncharacterized protein n=1 Tax=Niallia endozanthoxylica TaxID=2036016 RepID=A0A5J5HUI8_9BACI|nr:hypothetical protein [Niallia endozanthoxylica]KAA9025851.1 hypothetical protein F4V44_08170 [Niallia endozanthoxylica]
MTVFFIIISFIINIIAIMGIVILFLRQNKLVKVDENQKKTMKEMEELMSSYILEMKDENERFIKRFETMNKVQFSSNQLPEKASIPHKEFEKKPDSVLPKVEKQELSSRLESTVNFQAVRAYQKQTQNQPGKEDVLEPDTSQAQEIRHDEVVHNSTKDEKRKKPASNERLQESLLFQILNMKQEGFSIEEIAKRLNKGQSEIALLLKINENHKE